jgi:hypothetical protein
LIALGFVPRKRDAEALARQTEPPLAPWSTRNFGEYALLEDSRYTSQAKNATARIVVLSPQLNGVPRGTL